MTDIFIKSYLQDAEWLKHCLRSINKFCSGFRGIVLVVPQNEAHHFVEIAKSSALKVDLISVVEEGAPYLSQQVLKLHADRYSDADQWLTIDSDCVFTRPITPETFVRDGKIIWLKTPMGQSGGEVWLESMRAWYGATPQFEYMRRHPFLLPKFLLEEMRKFTQFMSGLSLSDYIMQAVQFSEFNCAGLLAEAKFKDRFLFLDTTKDEIPTACVKQWHSHDGVESALEEIEAILGTEIGREVTLQSDGTVISERPVMFMPAPAGMRAEPEWNPVSFAIATLAAEAQKGPQHKGRVAAALVRAGLVKAKAKKPAKRRMAKA